MLATSRQYLADLASLLSAARQLMWRTSTARSGTYAPISINSGSLYHFFPGKQDLLLAVLEAYRSGIGEMLLAPAWEGVDDPIGRVFALLDRYRRGIVQTECFYACPIGSLALHLEREAAKAKPRKQRTSQGAK
jgi:AcrR family transcriptional regulator